MEIATRSLSGAKLQQPRALTWLFLTELWERFSYWSLYSLLVLYLVHRLHFSDANAYIIFASFNALLYASPIIGGWIADTRLGQTHSIIQGAVWLVLGYILLAFAHQTFLIYLSLGLLIWGNGLFKPNIGSQLGACYQENDSKRQRGFTIYYMGINIGATLGVLGCGWLVIKEGWLSTFLLVAFSMFIGLMIYLIKFQVIQSYIKKPALVKPNSKSVISIIMLGLLLVAPLGFMLSVANAVNIAMVVVSVFLAGYLIHIAFKQDRKNRRRMLLCLILTAISIAFWALYMQIGSSLTLYTQRCVDLNIAGYKIDASMVVSLNGSWLLLLSPLLVKSWKWLELKKREPLTATKFLISIVAMMLGYLVLAVSASALHPGEKSNLIWVVLSYGLQTLGELCLSPIGLAMVTELAPDSCKSLMMGVWFLATAIASLCSGQLAKIATVPSGATQAGHIAAIYAHAFYINALLAFVIIVIFACFMGRLRKLL